jgi:hypothetical protein
MLTLVKKKLFLISLEANLLHLANRSIKTLPYAMFEKYSIFLLLMG